MSDIRVTKAGKPVVSPYTNAIDQAYIVDASAPDGGPPIDLLPTPTPESFKADVFDDVVQQNASQQWTIARLTPSDFPMLDFEGKAVLQALYNAYPEALGSRDIQAATRITRKTTDTRVYLFIEKACAERPEGKNRGVVLTHKGLLFAEAVLRTSKR